MEIRELQKDHQIRAAFPVMNQLRNHLDEEEYVALVKEAKEKDMYRLFGLFIGEEIVAVIGFKPMITLYYGRFVWVCDLVAREDKRSLGNGEKLLSFVHQWATEEGYEKVALSSGLQRENAHRFYEQKMNYERVSFVFKKDLER
ncbi:putative N-acetyltransferase YhdJ [Halobacillus andaensis]|uniref:N-acetyltransferase YhdJ n=1 Tax=Halobacillus andaensis TaxID=1176239 RepID=A0A917EWI3_HALAA|nr:GNAT family N-acetyltransferase [Halobacillus andaensis]MBP2005881.1 GNAT superfamily N-acetyltransferase [Halobacillus andaensis]GGF25371.1 putative N-acetyltransferase YhdJ [Halobacillus andaensis]